MSVPSSCPQTLLSSQEARKHRVAQLPAQLSGADVPEVAQPTQS